MFSRAGLSLDTSSIHSLQRQVSIQLPCSSGGLSLRNIIPSTAFSLKCKLHPIPPHSIISHFYIEQNEKTLGKLSLFPKLNLWQTLLCGCTEPRYNLVLRSYKDLEMCINTDLSEWFWYLALAPRRQIKTQHRLQGKAGTEIHLQNHQCLDK